MHSTTQEQDLAPHLETLRKALGSKIGTELKESDIKDEFAKYLEYGVPVDQAIRTILRHHGVVTASARPVGTQAPQGLIPLANLPANANNVHLKARVLTINLRDVVARGESKQIVWGLLGDETGSAPYTSWRPLTGIEKGDVIEVQGAYTKEYNGQGQVNFGDRTIIEKLDAEAIPRQPITFADTRVADLKEGLRGIRVSGRILAVAPRQVTVKEQPKTLWGGVLADASGQVEFTSWHDHQLQPGQAVTIEGGYVRGYRGTPQFNFDQDAKVTPATIDIPALEALAVRPATPLATIVERNGGNDVTVTATLLEVRAGSGLVLRCSTAGCTRVLTAGQCRLHNRVEGTPDLRIKGILDDGTGAISVIVGRELTEKLLDKNLDQCVAEAKAAFRPEVIWDQLREKLTARVFTVRGNAMSDEYGIMLIARAMAVHTEDVQEEAEKLAGALAAAKAATAASTKGAV